MSARFSSALELAVDERPNHRHRLPVNASVGLTLTDASARVTNVKIADVNPSDKTSTGTQEPLCR
jgi:hypothetical protein